MSYCKTLEDRKACSVYPNCTRCDIILSFSNCTEKLSLRHVFYTHRSQNLKARSHDPILRIRFLVPKIGSRRSDGPISRFCFCGENVGRPFVVCSHDPIFRTNKESSIWRQTEHRDIMQNLSAPFIFQEECRMKIEHVPFPSVSSKLRICVLEGRFQCVHTIRFSESTKIGSLKTDRASLKIGEILKIKRKGFIELLIKCQYLSFWDTWFTCFGTVAEKVPIKKLT